MADPLALVTLAVAAAGGRYADQDTGALVAAGHTLLRRSAVLVRALGTTVSAVALPAGGPWLTALAASDGRGALLLDPAESGAAVARALTQHGVRALFTTEPLARRWGPDLPPGLVQVWLDRAPAEAVVVADGEARGIDLGSHFGLELVGDTATEGLEEPFVWADGAWHTHRAVLAAARAHAAVQGLTPVHWMAAAPHWALAGLVHQLGILLQGGRVTLGDAPG
ncbi:MAG: hypothetical protein K2R93_13355 [Gemmatimonadaceae bacterium]|nr:hypothetical protein [Gemmatimonadaceae bacterium]